LAKKKTEAENAQASEEIKEQEVLDERDEQIKKLEEELAALKEQHLRTLAEYDNYRKRTEREKLEIYSNATVDAAAAILPIADNIERALEFKDADEQSMKKGIEMIYNQLKASFEKLGVEEMAGEGEEFNPELHSAVSHIDDENLEENVISAVYQKGYLLKDKVVRHAMVQVAN